MYRFKQKWEPVITIVTTVPHLPVALDIFTSSANITASHERPLKQSFMYIKKRTGPSQSLAGPHS